MNDKIDSLMMTDRRGEIWRGPVYNRTVVLRIEEHRSIGAWMAKPINPDPQIPFVYLFDAWFEEAEFVKQDTANA